LFASQGHGDPKLLTTSAQVACPRLLPTVKNTGSHAQNQAADPRKLLATDAVTTVTSLKKALTIPVFVPVTSQQELNSHAKSRILPEITNSPGRRPAREEAKVDSSEVAQMKLGNRKLLTTPAKSRFLPEIINKGFDISMTRLVEVAARKSSGNRKLVTTPAASRLLPEIKNGGSGTFNIRNESPSGKSSGNRKLLNTPAKSRLLPEIRNCQCQSSREEKP
jgi:hypothetical protein